MRLDFQQLFFLGLLTSSIHWLVGRSEIAAPIWSRARGWLDQLLRCAGCSGFWLGLGASLAGVHPVAAHYRVVEIVMGGVAGVLVTPVFEGVMLWALRETTIGRDEHGDAEADPSLTTTGEVTPTERPPKV